MSYEGQDHHPHKRGYPPNPHLLLSSPLSIPPHLKLVQAHWFVRHGERAPVRERMVGLGDIPQVFQLCSIGRQFTSAVLTLSPPSKSASSSSQSSSLGSSPSPSNPFLSAARHTTSLSAPSPSPTPPHDAPVSQTRQQLPVTRFTQIVSPSSSSSSSDTVPLLPKRGGLSDCYWGELTDLGRESTLRFGSILRNLYTTTPFTSTSSASSSSSKGFLPSELDSRMLEEGVLQFRSTNMPRTIESLHQIIEGLYPSTTATTTTTTIDDDSKRSRGFSIPFMVRNWTEESLTPNTTACRKLRKLDLKSIKLACLEQNPSLAELDPLLESLFNGQGIRIDSSNPRASGVLDTLMVCRAHGIKVPKVLEDPKVLRVLENAVVHEWFDGYKDPEFKRLAMGRLFSDLHSHLSSKINNPESDKLKLSINSCHDTSVAGIMNAMEAFNGRWPAFTSSLGIELYKSNSTSSNNTSSEKSSSPSPSPSAPSSIAAPHHFIRILYNGKPLSLPGCSEPKNHLEGSEGKICTFSAFEKVLEKVELGEKEWREICAD
ncbi:hypothetical protein JCM5350_002743 [Sporobolomyces pararoseus]